MLDESMGSTHHNIIFKSSPVIVNYCWLSDCVLFNILHAILGMCVSEKVVFHTFFLQVKSRFCFTPVTRTRTRTTRRTTPHQNLSEGVY